jgi:uncharacterized repeat protein (TIGR01451 family)
LLGCLSSPLYANISGKVFRDFNANGLFDADTSFTEVGISGISIKAFSVNSNQPIATTISGVDGSYTLTGLDNNADYRVEFSWAAPWLQASSTINPGSGSSVQFVKDSASNINFGVNEPGDYAQIKPPLMMTTQFGGLPTGTNQNDPSLYSIPYDATGLNHDLVDHNYKQGTGVAPSHDATMGNTGSVWGLAWQAEKKRAFLTSYIKRHSGLLDGAGYVYIVDYQNYVYQDNHTGTPGNIVGKFNLQGVKPTNSAVALDFGSICRSADCASNQGNTGIASDYELNPAKNSPTIDLDGFKNMGRMSIGDAEMQPSSNNLWLVNLYQRGLVSVDVSGPSNNLPGEVRQYLISDMPNVPSCSGGTLRPWALAFRSGRGYLGAVCDAMTSQNKNDLIAYVLSFDPNNMSAGFNHELTIPMNYDRSIRASQNFMPWLDVYTNPPVVYIGTWVNFAPQPVLSDIDFDENGNMFISFMDRFGHQTGLRNYPAISNYQSTLLGYINFGEMLKACQTTSGFVLEHNAECSTSTDFAAFFDDISGDQRQDGATGSSAQWKGSNQLIESFKDPHPAGSTSTNCDANLDIPCFWNTQGYIIFDNRTGQNNNWYSARFSESTGDAGKSAGMGDIELMTNPAPIEIGNRVWLDINHNGIQDAGETGIDGLNVTLTCGSNTASMNTTNGGYYLFSNVTGGNATFMEYGSSCSINVAFSDPYIVTKQNADNLTDNNALNDIRDSDADNTGKITFNIGHAGENNHGLDIGLTFPPIELGDKVWIDINNNGLQDNGETGIDGVNILLTCGSNTASTTTANGGLYLFTNAFQGNAAFLSSGMNCSLSIVPGQSVLSIYSITKSNADGITDNNPNTDKQDSDADNTGTIILTVGSAGEKNYGFDFGYVPHIDLKLNKSVDQNTVKSGDKVTFTLSVDNQGPADATNVVVTDHLPSNLTFDSATGDGHYDSSNGLWTIGGIVNNQTKTIKITTVVQ